MLFLCQVIVFTGLKKVVGNEEEMAAVLGHEISHVLARHGAESMTLMTLMQGGLIVLALLGFPVNVGHFKRPSLVVPSS